MIIKIQDKLPKIKAILAGTDEAGRGPLVGNVVAAAVILNPQMLIKGLDDSKKISESKRLHLSEEIKQKAIAWSIKSVSASEIDKINILQASLLAMKQAIADLIVPPQQVFVDGNQLLSHVDYECYAIIKGDCRVAEISAASILAKVERDAQMVALDIKYPEYGFARHKGYATKAHREILQEIGPCQDHRMSFAPVREAWLHHRQLKSATNN